MGVKVSELGGDNAAGFHLLQTTRTHASSHGVVLRPRQNLGNCLMVAADAADKARRNTDLAVKTHQIANLSADQRLEDERAFLKDQALEARDVQDAQDNAAAEERKRRDDLTARMEALIQSLPDSEDSFTPPINLSAISANSHLLQPKSDPPL